MQETEGGLRVRRVLVEAAALPPVVRVELSDGSCEPDAGDSSRAEAPPEPWLRPPDLVEIVRSYHLHAVLLHCQGRGAWSGVIETLQRLRQHTRCWLGMQTLGSDPNALRQALREQLLDFVDVQLAWIQPAGSPARAVRVDPTCLETQAVMSATRCPCTVRFACPPTGEAFRRLSSGFDRFVRTSREPVAVQVLDLPPDAEALATRAGVTDALEFVAWRPASLLHGCPVDRLDLLATAGLGAGGRSGRPDRFSN